MKTDLQASHGAAALWHPVVLAADLQSKPYAAHLLGQNVVVWRDLNGQAHAWADQCPHRGARLSLGRVCEGRLECPYHGWQFEGSGRCVHVPALPGFTPPAGHSAQVFEVQECYGLVWVRLNTRPKDVASAAFALPAFGAETDTRLRKINCGPYDVATSAPRIVENFLDMSHFSFVHAGWLGDRASPSIEDYQVELTATGLLATGCKAWQPQSNLHSTEPALVEYSYEVTAPYAAVLTKIPEAGKTAIDGWRESIALFICPMTPESSRVWFRLAVADFDSTEVKFQEFQHTIFTQDQPVLESQKPKCLPLDLQAEAHTAADKASSMYRRFLKNSAIEFGTC